MLHRHITSVGYSSAAIDDIISRGSLRDWTEMRDAALADSEIMQRIGRARERAQSTLTSNAITSGCTMSKSTARLCEREAAQTGPQLGTPSLDRFALLAMTESAGGIVDNFS